MTQRASGRCLLMVVALAFSSPQAMAAVARMKVFTGPERGTQAQVGRDIARVIGRSADIDIEVVPTAGSIDSLQRLRDESGMRLAVLQSDAIAAYRDIAAPWNQEAKQMLAPLRVVAPLYEEVIYFIVRNDSAFKTLNDIRDARINVGPSKSGSALSATTLYRLLFGGEIAHGRTSFFGHEEALVKLLTDQSVDVVAVVGEQPAKLLADMKPEARRYIRLLGFDPAHPGSAAALTVYSPSSIRAASYPNLLTEDLPAFGLRLYLVAFNDRRSGADALLTRFARAWCQNLPRLKAEGHGKWRDVELAAGDLISGWHSARPVAREILRCTTGAVPPPDVCGQTEAVLGLCE